MKLNTVLVFGALAGLACGSANASMIVWDDPSDPEKIASSVTQDGLTVTAGSSGGTFNLANTAMFDRSEDIADAEVHWDTSPADGGLGVESGLGGDTDNLEGSLDSNTNNDEILFFDFGKLVELTAFVMNAGDESESTSHQDLFDDGDSDVFNLFWSDDADKYTSFTGGSNQSLENDNETLTAGGVTAQYFGIAHVGPTDSVGGYVEEVRYSVPVPAPLALVGVGLLMMGAFSSSRRRS